MNELQTFLDDPALTTQYGLLFHPDLRCWNATTNAWASFDINTSNYLDFLISLVYNANFPFNAYIADLPDGILGPLDVRFVVMEDLGSGAGTGKDRYIRRSGVGILSVKPGLAANGSRLVSMADRPTDTPPAVTAGQQTTVSGMVQMLYRRFFCKSTMDGSNLKCYAADGTSIVTTQALTDNGTVQTQGNAT